MIFSPLPGFGKRRLQAMAARREVALNVLDKRRSGDTEDGGQARIESSRVLSCGLTLGVVVRLY
jgi:hypothetical protein